MGSMERLAAYFAAKTDNLKRSLEIQTYLDSSSDAWPTLYAANNEVEEMETMLDQMRSMIDERRKALVSLEVSLSFFAD
jgi:hypothetical protein